MHQLEHFVVIQHHDHVDNHSKHAFLLQPQLQRDQQHISDNILDFNDDDHQH